MQNRDPILKKYVYYHSAINSVHGIIHIPTKVGLNTFQLLYVGIVIMFLPLFGLYISKNNKNTGNLICIISIFAAAIFSTYYHFILISPDHVSQVPLTNIWGYLFHMTAYLVSLIDCISVYKIYNLEFLDKYKSN